MQNVVNNIHAAFVEFEKNKVGFLPLSECQGKTVKAGDEFVVQIKQAAVKTKQPVLTIFPEIAGRFAVVSTKSKTKGVSKKITEEEKKKETTPPVSGLKLSKSSGSAVKKELSEDKPKEIVRKINGKTLDQIYAGERGLIICPFCETFNSQKNTRCCACGQPIRK